MNGKLLFLDIDGTLTEPGYNTPPESALKAIKMAQKNGHKVFLCSGRNLAMLRPLLKYGFNGYVASAGGYVVALLNVLTAHTETTDLKTFLKAQTNFQTASFCASAVSSVKP